MPDALPVLYQDDTRVVIHKPSDLLVFRSPIDRHETRFAVQQLHDRLGRHVYPMHRLTVCDPRPAVSRLLPGSLESR